MMCKENAENLDCLLLQCPPTSFYDLDLLQSGFQVVSSTFSFFSTARKVYSVGFRRKQEVLWHHGVEAVRSFVWKVLWGILRIVSKLELVYGTHWYSWLQYELLFVIYWLVASGSWLLRSASFLGATCLFCFGFGYLFVMLCLLVGSVDINFS